MRIIGIDPGKSGGIAWCNLGFMRAWPMPNTEKDISNLLSDMHFEGETFCYLERVHAMPGQGVTSMFTFGQGYGFLRGCLVSLRIPFEEVRPQQWQKALNLSPKGDKNILKQKAQQLFPDQNVTLKTADALLIAEYGRRLYEQKRA